MKKNNIKLKTKKILYKTVPLWLTAILIFNSVIGVGFLEYLIMKRNFNQYPSIIKKALEHIESNYLEPLTLNEVFNTALPFVLMIPSGVRL